MLVSETRPSGLIVARDSMDEASVQRALKALDRRLVLQKHARDGVAGGWVYKVICFVSDTYAPVVFTWMDELGTPLPLSSALIDEMQRHMLGARNKGLSADEHNARFTAQIRKDAEHERDEIVRDHIPYLAHGRVGVALGTRSKKRYWQREGTPKSGKGPS